MVGDKDQEAMVGEEERACLIYPSSGGLFGFGQIKGTAESSTMGARPEATLKAKLTAQA